MFKSAANGILGKAKILFIAVISLMLLNGCAWVVAAAVAGAAGTVIFTAGSVGDIDKTDKALAVEKLIYAFESNKGKVTDLSFADGYVKGIVDNHTVTAHIYTKRNGSLNINVRATKNLISNADVAQKVIDKYRNYVR